MKSLLHERRYSLSKAARLMGMGRATLKAALAELGIIVPRVRRGQKVVVLERDLETLLARRYDARAAK